MNPLKILKSYVRKVVHQLAIIVNRASAGKITPNMISLAGLIAFWPVGWLIAVGYHGYAALGIIIFGLFDSLDGELARLQKSTSTLGMYLDSVFDRMKELLIYLGLGVYFYRWLIIDPDLAVSNAKILTLWPLTIMTLGLSVIVSYLNAWGEVAIKHSSTKKSQPNSTLRGGLAPYEIRLGLLSAGLLLGQVWFSLLIISTLCCLTIIDRINRTIKLIK